MAGSREYKYVIVILNNRKRYFCTLVVSACYEESDTFPCLHNGLQVLDQYSFEEANLAKDLWSMVTLYVIFNLLALFFLWKRARNLC